MELETIGVLANSVVLLAGGIVILIKSRNKTNSKVSQRKFDDQVSTCTERFLDIAEKSGQVGADIKSIKKSIEAIEKKTHNQPK